LLVNGFLVLKSSLSVVGLDIEKQSYCVLPPPADTEDYGDTLAGWGESEQIVIFAQTKASVANIQPSTIIRVYGLTSENPVEQAVDSGQNKNGNQNQNVG
jgi:hypothetical protein